MKTPKAQGLYDPTHEHDNCGIGLIVDMKGRRSHATVRDALEICVNLDHRGGCGCDPITGDGAGIFIQVPDKFFRTTLDFDLPPEGDYGAGFVYMSKCNESRQKEINTVEQVVSELGLNFIGWRDVPVKSEILGKASP